MFKVFDLLNGSRITPSYVEQALAQGVTAIHITINNFSTVNPLPSLRDGLDELAAVRRHYAALGGLVQVIESYGDFERAAKAGKLGVVFGYQNVPGVERDLKLLQLFHDLGVRVIQIAHNVRNLYADGCAEPGNGGLSALGRELVAEMNRLGIVIDLSHTGDRSSVEAAQFSKHPVTATHANAFAVCDNVRNRNDQTLDAIKANGGVIGICYLPPIVRKGVKPTHAEVAAHVNHVYKRIGLAHIAIGSDFITDQPPERYQEFMKKPEVYGTWPWRYPVEDLADQQRFLESLRGLGLSDKDIGAIAQDNALRVFKAVLK